MLATTSSSSSSSSQICGCFEASRRSTALHRTIYDLNISYLCIQLCNMQSDSGSHCGQKTNKQTNTNYLTEKDKILKSVLINGSFLSFVTFQWKMFHCFWLSTFTSLCTMFPFSVHALIWSCSVKTSIYLKLNLLNSFCFPATLNFHLNSTLPKHIMMSIFPLLNVDFALEYVALVHVRTYSQTGNIFSHLVLINIRLWCQINVGSTFHQTRNIQKDIAGRSVNTSFKKKKK